MDTHRLATTVLERARRSIDRHVAWIDREIGGIEAELDRRVAANPQWAEIDRLLQFIPAVGPQTSCVLIGHLPELGQVDREVIGRLLGVAPVANDSGTTAGPHRIVGGRTQARNALDMVAVAAVRWNPVGKALRAAEGQGQVVRVGPHRRRPQAAHHRRRDGRPENPLATFKCRDSGLTSGTVTTGNRTSAAKAGTEATSSRCSTRGYRSIHAAAFIHTQATHAAGSPPARAKKSGQPCGCPDYQAYFRVPSIPPVAWPL